MHAGTREPWPRIVKGEEKDDCQMVHVFRAGRNNLSTVRILPKTLQCTSPSPKKDPCSCISYDDMANAVTPVRLHLALTLTTTSSNHQHI
jgi:hypothetical protein